MKSNIYKTCLGCLTGTALTLSAQAVQACEAHAFLATQTAEAQTAASKTAAQSPVMAMDAWVPVAPPGVKAHAAYLVLMNHGGDLRAVAAVHSPQYASAAMHASQVKDGVNVMQHLAQVDLPAGSSVAFKPHGLHIMLMGPKKPLAPGDTVDLVLTLDDGSTVTVKAEVRKRGATAPMNHGHMGHDHKGS
ncbi:MAG: copper chaperone PCu(A)C [Rhodospirillales bacterium]